MGNVQARLALELMEVLQKRRGVREAVPAHAARVADDAFLDDIHYPLVRIQLDITLITGIDVRQMLEARGADAIARHHGRGKLIVGVLDENRTLDTKRAQGLGNRLRL